MGKALIFVSCGQLTEAERTLGLLVKAVIDGTPGCEAYFAETVQDVEALGRHVLEGIRRCAGAVVILQDRGTVIRSDGSEWGHRSSVWVNQEIAILSYRQFLEARRIPIIAFVDPSVRLEGAMTALIVNPKPFSSSHDLVDAVKAWLRESNFGGGSDDAFLAKWARLTDSAKRILAALLDEGGHQVKEAAVRQRAVQVFGISKEAASQGLRESKLEFMNTDLVRLIHDINSGDELSVHPTWEFQIRRASSEWAAAQKSK